MELGRGIPRLTSEERRQQFEQRLMSPDGALVNRNVIKIYQWTVEFMNLYELEKGKVKMSDFSDILHDRDTHQPLINQRYISIRPPSKKLDVFYQVCDMGIDKFFEIQDSNDPNLNAKSKEERQNGAIREVMMKKAEEIAVSKGIHIEDLFKKKGLTPVEPTT